MNPSFEPLAFKVAEANRKRAAVRGRATGNGVTVEVDADGRTVGLDLGDAPRYLDARRLAELILELCREAERDAAPAIAEAVRELREDPLAMRVATFTQEAIGRAPARPRRPLTEAELAARQTERIARQLRNR
jgi:hypothetical protein